VIFRLGLCSWVPWEVSVLLSFGRLSIVGIVASGGCLFGMMLFFLMPPSLTEVGLGGSSNFKKKIIVFCIALFL
jgi:hypothetical protein